MKKIFLCLIVVISSLFACFVIAETQPVEKPKQTVQQNVDEILLYEQPDGQKILKKLAANARLIPFYQQKEWVKMGDPSDGQVGWVNIQQYQTARANYFRPNIQTFYVTTNQENGKPTLNIVAYKNGQQLSKEEALKLYNHLRAEQDREFQMMNNYSNNIRLMMDRDFQEMQNNIGPSMLPRKEPNSVGETSPTNDKEKIKNQQS